MADLRIDLHAHSRASDGTLPPAGIGPAAAAAGLDVVALTDHDTLAGWDEATAALPRGVTLVPGVEISCAYRPPGAPDAAPVSLHLLAYLVDPQHPPLRTALERVRAGRTDRGRAMVASLQAAGHPVSLAAVLAEAAGGAVGRPHVAAVLARAGLVPDPAAAFTPEWIGDGGRHHVRKTELDVVEAIRLVRAAGGVPVFAHPRAARRGPIVPRSALPELAAAGLAGVEVDHPDHLPEEREQLRSEAADLDLLVTGASDFHGSRKPVALGTCTTHPDAYAALLAEAHGSPPRRG